MLDGTTNGGRNMMLKAGPRKEHTNMVDLMSSPGGRSGESIMMEGDLTDKWAETELGTKWGDKWEEKFFARIGSRQGETWHVGQGHGEKSTLEMVRCTNMGKARLGKAGILLWTRRPITRLSRITDEQMLLVTLANCCQLNLEKGHLVSTLPLILDHCRLRLMNRQMNFLHNERLGGLV
ncbi:hypothetical protein ACFX14_039658 [Malus domestica]